MNRIVYWLGGLLALQLALALGLYWGGLQSATGVPRQPLLTAATGGVDRIEIGDGEESVTLLRAEDGWVVSPDGTLPADTGKVEELLQRLEDTQTGWPVSTTVSGVERFEVAEDKFQRRLTLYDGDAAVADLYLGTSPGFRRVHLRRAGENAVYAVELNTYDLPATQGGWLDKTLLAMDGAVFIAGPDYQLEKTDDTWHLATPEGGDAVRVDPDKAAQLAAALAGLRVQAAAAEAPGDAAEGVQLTVRSADGQHEYRFTGSDTLHLVRRDDRDRDFTLSQYDFDRIAAVRLADLLPDEGAQEADAGQAGGGEAAAGGTGAPAAEGEPDPGADAAATTAGDG